MQMIADQSNLYAKQTMSADKFEQFEKITVEDLDAFIGCSILMAINPRPAIYLNWSTDPVYRYDYIADRITRDRYREISRYLHYADNTSLSPRGTSGFDRLGKVRPLLSYLHDRFSSVYTPGRRIAVDEAMIKFQGRSSLKQYMPKKPIKRGIKVWVLGESNTGYFSRFEVYCGKKDGATEHNLGARVVKDLTKDFQGKYHTVFFDNFFTSWALIQDLEDDGIYSVGTARKDRKQFPQQLKNVKLHARYVYSYQVNIPVPSHPLWLMSS
jgi:hypothetical protein